ncbi:hypothetical protein CMQ_7044 [Grosmannia clavigera kw1407]|uniref:Uncharacterized protein n=1 Tax=Grosmannia clavigera (strain kw1407 / UAMH 11150) TaxID=655863 RepID=F0XP12_GROCL|nr:uncharacterized protein CMQ_7044 [Grosmannia clavigera kw1407]EFX00042.1 hypothetical protein CMQ_7044 [Grosmannia clavigera kw1407]
MVAKAQQDVQLGSAAPLNPSSIDILADLCRHSALAAARPNKAKCEGVGRLLGHGSDLHADSMIPVAAGPPLAAASSTMPVVASLRAILQHRHLLE